MSVDGATSDETERPLVNAITVAAAIALGIFATAYTPLNSDLGWILDFGRQARQLGHLPMTNARSFIEPDHPLILHEWAMCLLFYRAHLLEGVPGLILVRWFFVAATLAVVGLTVRRITRDSAARLVTLLVAAQTLSGGFQLIRPQLASFLLLAMTVHLGLFGTRRSLWWALPLFAAWANLHGGWLAGVVALGAACGGRLIEQWMGWRRPEVPVAVLVAVPLVAPLCILLNPWGWHLIVHTLHHATDEVRLWNQEWRPLWHAGPLAGWEKWAVGLLIGSLAVSAWLLPPRRVALWLLLLLGVAAGFSAIRNLRIAPLLMAPGIACALGDKLGEAAWRSARRWEPFIAGLLFLTLALPLGLSGRRLFTLMEYPPPNPGTALWMMQRNHLTGRLWSDFNWGGTILWALPDVQIGVDGRNVAAYSPNALRASMLFDQVRDPVAMLEDYKADMALLPKTYAHLDELAKVYQPLFCEEDVCLLSRLPDQIAQARAGLVRPPRPILASELFE